MFIVNAILGMNSKLVIVQSGPINLRIFAVTVEKPLSHPPKGGKIGL